MLMINDNILKMQLSKYQANVDLLESSFTNPVASIRVVGEMEPYTKRSPGLIDCCVMDI